MMFVDNWLALLCQSGLFSHLSLCFLHPPTSRLGKIAGISSRKASKPALRHNRYEDIVGTSTLHIWLGPTRDYHGSCRQTDQLLQGALRVRADPQQHQSCRVVHCITKWGSACHINHMLFPF